MYPDGWSIRYFTPVRKQEIEIRSTKFETKMLNPKLEIPAFAEAASRRQAKL